MNNWTELKTAFYVAKLGTISQAAEALDVHRATVLRHINQLESMLGDKLFIRNNKGYELTDLGAAMLETTSSVQEQFDKLAGAVRLKKQVLTGDILITSLELNSFDMFPMLACFRAHNPHVQIQYLVGDTPLRLDYGEAHIAIRTGTPDNELDCVVRPFMRYQFGLYAHERYVANFGLPKSVDDFPKHFFVGTCSDNDRSPFGKALKSMVPNIQYSFLSKDHPTMNRAVRAGMGIGFLPANQVRDDEGLFEVLPPDPQWSVTFRLVTHGDVHRSAKIQTFLNFIKDPGNHTESFAKVCIFGKE